MKEQSLVAAHRSSPCDACWIISRTGLSGLLGLGAAFYLWWVMNAADTASRLVEGGAEATHDQTMARICLLALGSACAVTALVAVCAGWCHRRDTRGQNEPTSRPL